MGVYCVSIITSIFISKTIIGYFDQQRYFDFIIIFELWPLKLIMVVLLNLSELYPNNQYPISCYKNNLIGNLDILISKDILISL